MSLLRPLSTPSPVSVVRCQAFNAVAFAWVVTLTVNSEARFPHELVAKQHRASSRIRETISTSNSS